MNTPQSSTADTIRQWQQEWYVMQDAVLRSERRTRPTLSYLLLSKLNGIDLGKLIDVAHEAAHAEHQRRAGQLSLLGECVDADHAAWVEDGCPEYVAGGEITPREFCGYGTMEVAL